MLSPTAAADRTSAAIATENTNLSTLHLRGDPGTSAYCVRIGINTVQDL